MRFRILLSFVVTFGALMLPTVSADDSSDIAEMKEIVRKLNLRIEKLEQEKIGTMHKEELARLMKEILADTNKQSSMPRWMKNLTFFGDLRLRYQMDHYEGRSGNLVSGKYADRRKNQNRIRFRLRFGFTKTWWDKQMEVGFRLASGSGSSSYDPDGSTGRSVNQTLTNMFSKKPIWIDLAYAKYRPKWAPGLVFAGGKMSNPIKSRTWMTWAPDINPEGFVAQYVVPYWGDIRPYVTAGYWYLENTTTRGANVITPTDTKDTTRIATMVSIGTGLDWEISKDMSLYFGGTMYMFQNYNTSGVGSTGIDGSWVNDSGWADSDMQLLELTSRFGWEMIGLPWEVVASWTHNFADNYNSDNALALNAAHGLHLSYNPQFDGASDAFLVGIKVGKNKKKGDWSAFYNYCYMEANSVVPGLTDATFNGPNLKGHVFGGMYNIDDFFTISSNLYLTDPIHAFDTWNSGVWQANSSRNGSVTLQVNMIWKF